MLNTFPISLITGSILGFLSGLGIGGGSLLILWLTSVLGMEQSAARMINLLFFLPCALVASLFRSRQGALNIKKLLPAIIAGCLGAAGFSFLAHQFNTEILKKLFGILLVATGVREILYRPRNDK